uniref:Thioredoxin domain-containing protein n=1 Tax=Araucaria cunninghamii TaxID=56994 RepID=A0A0D6QXY4_ARACU
MITGSKIKALDFYRKIPRDLTEASLSGAGLSIIAALCMIFLFGMELNSYMSVSTTTNVVVDRSLDGEHLRIDFNISFLALSCEFASVDVSDVLGTNRLNITKTVRKYSISPDMEVTGPEFHPGPIPGLSKHGDHDSENFEDLGEGSVQLNGKNFDRFSHEYTILVVNFYAPWCHWSALLRPSWEKVAKIMKERYDPEMDRRILMGRVDCTEDPDLCRRHHIQGYPSIRIFRKGSDVRDNHGHHEHEAYYGERDTESLVAAMEALVAPLPVERKLALEDKSGSTNETKRPAPKTGACRVEGFVRVKKVPGNLIISARSGSHSFDAAAMNMSHVISHFSFGRKLSWKLLKEVNRLSPYVGASTDRLSGKSYITNHENVTVDHYLQAVKSELISSKTGKDTLLEQYEYTAHSSMMQTAVVPVAKFHFELSPMQVLVTENSKSFSHFITNVCAIIGGVFTVAGILDSMFYNGMRLVRKLELGKQF